MDGESGGGSGRVSAADSTTPCNEFADDITATLVASGILALVMLLFGTSALGNELGDRTLGYLLLKPLRRPHRRAVATARRIRCGC